MALKSGTDIRSLYGVGEVRAAAYGKIGIKTVGDLLMHFPRNYENRGNVKLLTETDSDSKSAVILTVATEPRRVMIRRGMVLLKFRAYDDSASCEITFFNQDYLKGSFPLGSTFRFYGRVVCEGNKYTMSSPAYEPYCDGRELPPLIPVYPLTEGLSRKQVSKDIGTALVAVSADPDFVSADILPESIRRKNRLCTLSFALRNIHQPEDFASLAAAKKRLIYDEFFTFALGLSLTAKKESKNPAFPCVDTDISELTELLPYELTGAQKRVINEISNDISKDTAMSRIVIGDVGCGKTVCAVAAAYIAIKNGRQAVVMAPTEILARQHYNDMSALFAKLGYKCALLTGSVTAAAKRKIYEGLTESDAGKRIDIVVGTQALLSDGVAFAAPGIIVTDEQHRFGVDQRAQLSRKNGFSHMLVMSATPIPRTLALTLYGGLDISRIDEMPAGRQRVDTFVVDESYRHRLDAFIEKQVLDGGQVYVVCPVVAEKDDEDGDFELDRLCDDGKLKNDDLPPLKAAVQYAGELSERFPQFSVGFVHGKMKSRDKDTVMKEFSEGKINILVSTTVIEVGINVANASLMIIENAERFGLSQLHQLRGRVGRGKRKSYCVLVSESAGKKETVAAQRLETMKNTYDGFEIAEKDLALRGPGDFIRSNGEEAVRQSGGVKFRLAEFCDDTGLLNLAFSDAKKLVNESPDLKNYPMLRSAVDKMFTLSDGTIS